MLRLVHLEDDPLDAELIAAVLRRNFDCAIHQVSTEPRFREVLELAPDVILADAHLPGFDGLEAQRIAAALCPDVPFIYVSGTLGEEHAIERLTAGATDYVLKHRLAKLTSAVQRALQTAEERRARRVAEQALRELNSELERRVEERTLELRQAQAQAEQANRAKSEFISRMSHELRTPLNAILGFAQLLQLEDGSPGDRESVAQILKGGRHLLELINEVLDVARIEAGRLSLSMDAVSVPEILRHVTGLVRPLADARRIVIALDGPTSGAPFVMADAHRLAQVLVNLLSNAVKYNHEGGRIRLSWTERQGRLRVSVSDTGIGMEPSQLARLFMPFERLGAEQTNIEGTGLGLALSRRLVEEMAGSIGVESEPGRGSRFWLELALTTPSASRPDAEERPQSGSEGAAHGTLLYIEDNADNRRLMQRLVARRPRVELVLASDGTTGLQLALERRPDAIFLDLHLPDISGMDVLQRLLASPQTRDIPVTILTADATHEQQQRLRAAGAAGYLTKPLKLDRILQLLDGSLGHGRGMEPGLSRDERKAG